MQTIAGARSRTAAQARDHEMVPARRLLLRAQIFGGAVEWVTPRNLILIERKSFYGRFITGRRISARRNQIVAIREWIR